MSTSLSVVLAVQGGCDKLAPWLETFAAQLPEVAADAKVEVLVCHDAALTDVPAVVARFPFARALAGSDGALIPYLWRDGIDASEAERVALSIVHCQPGPGWLNAALSADLDSYAAVGGALENAPAAGALDWAVFLLRYLRYLPPFEPRETLDLPGDNVVYRRSAVLPHHQIYRDGFWEPEVHACMAQAGQRLRLEPSFLSVHDNGYSRRAFVEQRYRHGIRFGADRARAMPQRRRLLHLLSAPAVPAVFASKILRRALTHPVGRAHLLRAMPDLLLFVNAWVAGEMRGTLQAWARRVPVRREGEHE